MNIKDLMKEKMLCRATSPGRSSVLGTIIADAKEIAKVAKRTEVVQSDIEKSAENNASSLLSARKKVMLELKVEASDPALSEFNFQIAVSKEFYPPTKEDIELAVYEAILNIPEDQLSNRSIGLIKKAVFSKLGKATDAVYTIATAKIVIGFVAVLRKNS